MKTLWLLLIGSLCFAANSVTITSVDGSTQTNRPITISRVFAKGEIANYAQPRTGGTPLALWQCDVKSRWADGSLKHALVSFFATISGAVVVDFVNNALASSAGDSAATLAAGLDKSALLAFNAGQGGWDASIAATTNAGTVTRSARTMVTDLSEAANMNGSGIRYWQRGPVVTTVIVEDRSTARTLDFGWACVANCQPTVTVDPATDTVTLTDHGQQVNDRVGFNTTGSMPGGLSDAQAPKIYWVDSVTANTFKLRGSRGGPYVDITSAGSGTLSLWYNYRAASWATDATYRSLHPVFILSFYAGLQSVKVDYILENVWTTALQDQAYQAVLTANEVTVYNQWVKHEARTRWRKSYWTNGTPADINIDHNLAYLAHSRALPNFDLTKVVPESQTADDLARFSASDRGVEPNSIGMWHYPRMGDGGGRPDIGIFPAWYVRYLYSQTNAMRALVLGQAEATSGMPIHLRESATGKTFRNSTDAFGRLVSINARPTFYSLRLNFGSAQDNISPVGTVNFTPTYSGIGNGWAMDLAHMPATAYLPYVLTGDWYLLEELMFAAGTALTSNPGGTDEWSRHRDWGYLNDGSVQVRGQAWGLRDIAHATFIAPDGLEEKLYFAEKLNNNIAVEEGFQGVVTGTYPPSDAACTGYSADSTTDKWCWGRVTVAHRRLNPLHFGGSGNSDSGSITNPALNQSGAYRPAAADSSFKFAYKLGVWGLIADLDFSVPLVSELFKFSIAWFADPACNPWQSGEISMPVRKADGTYYQTCAEFRQGYSTLYRSLNLQTMTQYDDPVTSDANYTDPGYPHIWKGVNSFGVGYSYNSFTGQQAWDWSNDPGHVGYQSEIGTNPQWAFVPRQTASTRHRLKRATVRGGVLR